MSNKLIGVIFCCISAVLMCTRYFCAALFMSNVSTWDGVLFAAGLEYVGSPLLVASVAALIAGIAFLGLGIYQELSKK